jgi:hypothetical protein
MFRERFGAYCKNNKSLTNILCGQNAEFLYVKAVGLQRVSCPMVTVCATGNNILKF